MMVVHPGGCLCGAVRFEALGDPLRSGYCHCAFCRRQTGAPVAAFADFRRAEAFRWTRGKPAVYRSSPSVRRSFCRKCGTPLAFEAESCGGEIHIHIGALDEPDRLPPTAHDHWSSRISWFDAADDLPRREGSGELPQ